MSKKSPKTSEKRSKLTVRERVAFGVLLVVAGFFFILEPAVSVWKALFTSDSTSWGQLEDWARLAVFAGPIFWLLFQLVYIGDYKHVESSQLSKQEKQNIDLDAGKREISAPVRWLVAALLVLGFLAVILLVFVF
jgi:fatty acid desaturase